ncbi:Thioredoxin reductase [Actinomadura sp. RB99]|nr:Thioredoxin reductase [Actinomadura sp. RB99]
MDLADGSSTSARWLSLATGVIDELPPIPGLAELGGKSVFHCPYCHGWEMRDQPVAVIGGDDEATNLAIMLARPGCTVTICSNGEPTAADQVWDRLRAAAAG